VSIERGVRSVSGFLGSFHGLLSCANIEDCKNIDGRIIARVSHGRIASCAAPRKKSWAKGLSTIQRWTGWLAEVHERVTLEAEIDVV